jgi:hypothetical protein
MTCPACGGHTVAFDPPAELRDHAPGSASRAALCATCLRTHPADGDADGDLSTVHPAFPTGEGGAALALALGLLDSLALRRADIDDCCSFAERAGVDVLLTLDRLAAGDGIDPHVDIERRGRQLADVLE